MRHTRSSICSCVTFKTNCIDIIFKNAYKFTMQQKYLFSHLYKLLHAVGDIHLPHADYEGDDIPALQYGGHIPVF